MKSNVKLLVLSLIFCASNINLCAQETNEKLTKTFYSYSFIYPQKALESRITGTITLIFDIDSACNFINISQDTTLGYGCDEFALKTLQHVEEQRKIENKLKCKKSYNHKIPVKFRLE